MDFHVSEVAVGNGAGVPAAMVVPVIGRTVRMRGTDRKAPRCIALAGTVGERVCCTIYADRPSPCHEFAPYAPLGMGDDACARARRRHGLAPL